jgi:hypothetical protein
MNDRTHPLDRATELARREQVDTADWEQTAAGVMRRIRASIRPGRPLRATLPDDRGSATFVNERVVVALVRQALLGVDGAALADVRVEVAGDRCAAVRLELVARYGADLQLLGERCRAVASEVLAGVRLADPDEGAVDVHVSVVDVTLHDPRH